MQFTRSTSPSISGCRSHCCKPVGLSALDGTSREIERFAENAAFAHGSPPTLPVLEHKRTSSCVSSTASVATPTPRVRARERECTRSCRSTATASVATQHLRDRESLRISSGSTVSVATCTADDEQKEAPGGAAGAAAREVEAPQAQARCLPTGAPAACHPTTCCTYHAEGGDHPPRGKRVTDAERENNKKLLILLYK